MPDLKEQIQHLSNDLFPQIREIRQHIHQNPELSFQEFQTCAYILQLLESFGISGARVVSKTGVVVDIQGKNPESNTRVLRADIDALPISEQSDAPYKSNNQGVMHACGHDVHTSCLLGAANILFQTRNHWQGTIRFIFQPGEEKLPGGASLMISEGVLNDTERIYGQHVFPELPSGHVGFKPGVYMASADEIYLTVRGRGGHAAMPHKNIDPVLIASHIVVAIQQIVSRRANPETPTVLSFGRFEGLGATNVIPSEAKLEGTFRTFDERWRFEAHGLIEQVATQVAASMGATIDLNIKVGYPVLHNNEQLTQSAAKLAADFLGEEHVHSLARRMTAEDFAYYTHEIPGCFYRLGTSGEDNTHCFPVHHPQFDIAPKSLVTGMGLMAWLAAKG
ncbi:MAG: amidohydrolase [Flavobacteriales bacterium]|nr:amidohydrolase [Flavobacteriales bacterium]